MKLNPGWIELIKSGCRHGFLSLLDEISRYQNFSFVIIGAAALMIQEYLDYPALWDLDLLFSNKSHLHEFADYVKDKYLRLEPGLMESKSISSLKTTWRRKKIWFNVDMIIKDNTYYTMFKKNAVNYEQSINYDNHNYVIKLCIAHPWDIFIDKLSSPRLSRELRTKNSMGVDIRHLFTILNKDQQNDRFYSHIEINGKLLTKLPLITTNFNSVIENASELGYGNFNKHQKLKNFTQRWSTV